MLVLKLLDQDDAIFLTIYRFSIMLYSNLKLPLFFYDFFAVSSFKYMYAVISDGHNASIVWDNSRMIEVTVCDLAVDEDSLSLIEM